MGDLLIRGMELPKTGRYFVAVDNTDGKDKTVISVMSEFERGDKTRPLLAVHEVVPVPPHGRLIDESALLKGCGYIIADGMACIPVKYIANAPTIIPTSEGYER